MKILLVALAGLAGVPLTAAAVGALLPRNHVARRTIRLKRAPEEIWRLIEDVDRFASWRSGITRVERLPDHEGRLRWREEGAHRAVTFERVAAAPPARLVTRIADPGLPFGGTWTYVIAPASDGSTVTITEEGEVKNPLFRFLSRFLLGHTATLDRLLRDLGKACGEEVTPVDA